MLKTFHITGYTVNKRGLTIGFNLNIQAVYVAQAKTKLTNDFSYISCSHTQITKITEVTTHA